MPILVCVQDRQELAREASYFVPAPESSADETGGPLGESLRGEAPRSRRSLRCAKAWLGSSRPIHSTRGRAGCGKHPSARACRAKAVSPCAARSIAWAIARTCAAGTLPRKRRVRWICSGRHPAPGEMEGLERFPYFCHRVLERYGRCNSNKGTEHHETQPIDNSMAQDEKYTAYTALGEEAGEKIVKHNPPATRQLL